MRRSVGATVLLLVTACGVFSGDDEPYVAPPVSPEDNAKSPDVVDGKPPEGIFVSSSRGSETGEGSAASPLQTLKSAFETAKLRGMRVIACAEDYAESVELVDGISAYGYYDCKDGWKRVEGRAQIKGAPFKPVIVAHGLTQPVRIEGFDVSNAGSGDAPPGTSAIAVSVRDSKQLVLSAMSIQAGDGAAGADGAEPAKGNTLGGAPNGAPAEAQRFRNCILTGQDICQGITHADGAGGGTATCSVGAAPGPGGQGGDGGFFRSGTQQGPVERRGRPFQSTTATNRGGDELGRGSDGTSGPHGGNGKNGVWSLSTSGDFAPGDGTQGTDGLSGQGGGGGGGSEFWLCPGGGPCSPGGNGDNWYAGTGAGGGAGGCGGLAGAPGTGGGASVGLFVVGSELRLESVAVRAAKGGRAGKGALGTAGIAGGKGGTTDGNIGTGGAGGSGGPGGNAGFAGHGAPGPSIALVWSGSRPSTDDKSELLPGAGGDGQPASTRGNQTPLPAVTGEAKAEHSF